MSDFFYIIFQLIFLFMTGIKKIISKHEMKVNVYVFTAVTLCVMNFMQIF